MQQLDYAGSNKFKLKKYAKKRLFNRLVKKIFSFNSTLKVKPYICNLLYKTYFRM